MDCHTKVTFTVAAAAAKVFKPTNRSSGAAPANLEHRGTPISHRTKSIFIIIIIVVVVVVVVVVERKKKFETRKKSAVSNRRQTSHLKNCKVML